MSITYLASPYSHPDPAVRHRRFEEVCKVAAELMAAGEVVFCPIAHSHPIDLLGNLPQTTAFWMSMDLPLLRACDRVKVLKLDGWDISAGIRGEIEEARAVGIPVTYIAHAPSEPPRTAHEGVYDE